MFLFFTCNEYDASGGVNDLIGKSEGKAWDHLTALLAANSRQVIEGKVKRGDVHERLLDEIHVLDVETMQYQRAEIIASLNERGNWEVEHFMPLSEADLGMLEGIPYDPDVKPKHPDRVLPFTPSPADFLYYRVTAVVFVRRLELREVTEQHHFTFIIKRDRRKPFELGTDSAREVATELTIGTFMFRHGKRIEYKHNGRAWVTQVPSCKIELAEDFQPSLAVFDSLPTDQAEARHVENQTYEDLPRKTASAEDAVRGSD